MQLDTPDIELTCRQCGRKYLFTKAEQEFYEMKGFTLPRRCGECRFGAQNKPRIVVCAQCGTNLEEGTPVYCSPCQENIKLEYELKTKQTQKVASGVHVKLQAGEFRQAELAESLRQKEKLITELELQVNNLSQDLDKANQFYTTLGPLQGALSSMGEKLEGLESAQNKTNERMLQIVQKISELDENISLLEIIKRSLRKYLKETV